MAIDFPSNSQAESNRESKAARDEDLRAFAMLLKAAIAVCGAIYYLVTHRKAPQAKDVLKEFS